MKNSVSTYVKILREICSEEEIHLDSYSFDWAFCLQKNGRKTFILGYQFGLNEASVQQICSDKNIASEILKQEGVPSVYHQCFMAPEMFPYIGGNGNWETLTGCLKEKKTLVCKDNFGTGGKMVFHVSNEKELEQAAGQIFASSTAMAVCDYEEIEEEYRLVVLDGQMKLAFSKLRQHLEGDGVSTLGELLGKQIAEGFGSGFSIPEKDILTRVLPKGEYYYLNWKHNLGQGADALRLNPDDLPEEIHALVKAASVALNIRFASIDVIHSNGSWKVLEVNSGVMMEHFASMSEENYCIAKDIYRSAILKMLNF